MEESGIRAGSWGREVKGQKRQQECSRKNMMLQGMGRVVGVRGAKRFRESHRCSSDFIRAGLGARGVRLELHSSKIARRRTEESGGCTGLNVS